MEVVVQFSDTKFIRSHDERSFQALKSNGNLKILKKVMPHRVVCIFHSRDVIICWPAPLAPSEFLLAEGAGPPLPGGNATTPVDTTAVVHRFLV